MSKTKLSRKLFPIAVAVAFIATAVAQPSIGAPEDTDPGAVLLGTPCPRTAPQRHFDVLALPVPISYNHFGDMDPEGRLFVRLDESVEMLDDVGTKLSNAGLGDLSRAVFSLRDAIEAEDNARAISASRNLVNQTFIFADFEATNDEVTRRIIEQDTGVGAEDAPQRNVPTDRFDVSDLVTPLVLRAHVGDCISVNLTDLTPEPVSFHAHAVVEPPGAGEALGLQAPDLAMPGESRTYDMWIPDWPGMEGAHFVHSHADPRDQTRHGMFGAIVAEPKGSSWLDTNDGVTEPLSGIAAIIDMPDGSPDFREFVQIYHDEIDLVDWHLNAFPLVSPYGEYGPGTKGINLRSEPFMTRFDYQADVQDAMKAAGTPQLMPGDHDKSQSYGSYTYGDPGVDIPRSYLSDPVKFRLINAGPGQHHIHHLHGGGIRWKATPMAEPSQFAIGLVKNADGSENDDSSASQRLDVQNVGPGEAFNLEPEGGSGGVQQSAGDFLFHCHIAEHYLSGMWSFWRTYNTVQPDLAQLPDRATRHQVAVNSVELLGTVLPDGTVLDETNIDAWVRAQLPAPGKPGWEDASVWDWKVESTDDGPLYLGERETGFVWPNFKADAPGRLPEGERPEILFDKNTGKLAFPMLRPHLGARPPFAPEHGPAPFLKNDVTTQNPDGLCPAGARPLKYNVVAIPAVVKYNRFDTDGKGTVFVRAEDRARYEGANAENPTSIVLRGNAGDCIDVTLTNALKEKSATEARDGIHHKTNIHIHLVQFDVQASDGVVAGFNYETTIRSTEGRSSSNQNGDPSAPVVTTLGAAGASAGATTIAVADVRVFRDALGNAKVGSLVGIDLGRPEMETAHLVSVSGVSNPPCSTTICNNASPGTITIDRPLTSNHTGGVAGARIGYEFVHYRWYPDVELGTVYFHDHVNGLDTWRHGLFGSLIVEPRASKWFDPARTSDPVNLTPQQVQLSAAAVAHSVDIIPGNGLPAYREFVLHFQDRACIAPGTDECLDLKTQNPQPPDVLKEPAGFNMRAEPLHRRNGDQPLLNAAKWIKNDASTPTVDERTIAQDDPSTDILKAYPGDNVVIRMLYAGQSQSRGVGTFALTGHRFPVEQYLPGGRVTDAVSMAESTQSNFQLECGAGGCAKLPGDYMYMMTQPEYLLRGAWGIFRVLDPAVDGTPLAFLPENDATTAIAGTFPTGHPVRYYNISAVEQVITVNPSLGITDTVRRFVPTAEALPDMGIALTPPSPLVLRAKPGEIVEVKFTNMLPSGRAGLHAGMLVADKTSQGIDLGKNPVNTVAPGQTITYRWFADREVGAVDLVSLVKTTDAEDGLYGALVVEPLGASFEPSSGLGTSATLTLANGDVAREHVVMFGSTDGQFQSSTMPYNPDVLGLATVNYASEPTTKRVGVQLPSTRDTVGTAGPIGGSGVSTCQVDPDACQTRPFDVRNPLNPFATSGIAPWTPILDAVKGEPLVIRVIGSAGDQLQTIHLDGHSFAQDPEMDACRTALEDCMSNLVSTFTVGPREVRNVWIPEAGMGGAGDYMYREHRDAFFEAGGWGLLRIAAPPET